MIANEQKELIAIEVIRTLHSQFEKFPDEETVNRNAPFHELFLKTFSEKFKNTNVCPRNSNVFTSIPNCLYVAIKLSKSVII